MNELSIGGIALSGPRLILRRPLAFAAWVAMHVVANFIAAWLTLVALVGPLRQLTKAGGDTQQLLAAFAAVAPGYLAVLALTVALYGVSYAAINRAVLRPDDNRFGYLRLGVGELRQVALMVVFSLIALAVYVAALVVAGVLALVVAPLVGISGQLETYLTIGGLLLALLPMSAFLSVKLSLASAATFEERKFSPFGGWRLSRGRFWRMFCAYLLAGLLAAATVAVSLLLFWAVLAVASPGVDPLMVMTRADTGSMRAYFTPQRDLYIALSSVCWAVILTVLVAPSATIYQQLAPRYHPAAGKRSVEEVFA